MFERLTMLEKILERKRQEIARVKERVSLEELKERVGGHARERDFRQAIYQPGRLCLIAELKRKSPSKGMLRERFDPVSLAQSLEEAGSSALSVLTDEPFFGGHLDFLRDVKQFTEIPVLRKDFIIDAYQLYESLFYQADAVLLIVRALSDGQLSEYLALARELGLDALVEIHNDEELKRAVRVDAKIIGINHRDLTTFTLDTRLSERLIPSIPSGTTVVAESGIQTATDVQRMHRLGVHALLIGEALMSAADVKVKVKELFNGIWDVRQGT